jgi:ParB/RepB/Spo0J family partition protein
MPESSYLNPEIVDLEIAKISIHPYQKMIRPFSRKYATYVHEEAVDQYAAGMVSRGYDRAQPIIVRPLPDGNYQCVVGWQRRTAMKANKQETIPTVIRDISEADAAMVLILNQGRQIETWGKARHAYQVTVGDRLMSQSAYAREVNVGHSTVNEWVRSVEVMKTVAQANDAGVVNPPSEYFTVGLAKEIATSPEEDWKWLTELTLEKRWSKAIVERVVSAVKQIQIPDEFKSWVNPHKYKREVAVNVGDYDDRLALDSLLQNIKDAQGILDKLPEDRVVWEFEAGLPKASQKNLKQKFLGYLADSKPTTRSQIAELHKKLLDWVKGFDDKYKRWEETQRTQEEKKKAEEAVAYERTRLQVEYAPVGLNGPIDRLDLEPDHFDVAFIHYPPSEENVNWARVVSESLKPGGLLVALCESGDDLFFLSDELDRAELMYLELRPWIYPSSEARERFIGNTGFIAVYCKDGELPFLPEFDRLTKQYGAGATGESIVFLKGNNKDDIYVKLIPYLLDCYAPSEAAIFCPCVQDGAIVSAAKSTPDAAYKITWSTLEAGVFDRVTKEVESVPFYWEV